ncbi:MAG: hypothetical protein SVJ22_08820 [Halobacteriota archaeon]|nr:hypothetical protein [Halobacteriota archaeon]
MKNIIRVILALLILSSLTSAGMYQVKLHVDPWLEPVVTEGELQATEWISKNTPDDAKFVAGIFGGEVIMGMTTRAPLVGGDWANAPDPTKNMNDAQSVFITPSSKDAHAICKEHNCTYVSVPTERQVHTGYGWVDIERNKFEDEEYFKLVYENSDVVIYEVI